MTAIGQHPREDVVLVDDAGRSVGTHAKATVHSTRTPLHLAFSCYVFNSNNEVLVTVRAHGKPTWPGVTTNSCCGHPAPGEDLGAGVVRRLAQELGIDSPAPTLLLPRFRYRAEMSNGMVENELCPVFGVLYDGPAPEPNLDEVDRAEWIPWRDFSTFVLGGGDVSPWCSEQVPLLVALGDEPTRWPAGDPAQLPAAATYTPHLH
ncbi:isopentenyl-diphosphate Delta-isomerase [Rhodococcoides yunnanense]|uniref:isopentenyl-diphosphate Delta-isomerase n=1 Tax=Rhodococcoides yunnanense TaxID=278209 RepID=UPI0009FE2625|nr:isopentenyl-diphosphate Delta-isomerase [Rhodococcus yunnanensis]